MRDDRTSLQGMGLASADLVVSMLLLVLGLTVTTGWLVRIPAMVEIKAGLVPMVFNTGLCFTLTGIAVLLMRSAGPQPRRLRRGIGLVLLLLCGATFTELLLDRSLGVDLAFLHSWYDYGNTRPGRMAPNTALGFMLIGAAILLIDHVARRWHAIVVVLLSFAVLAIGLTGLAGYLLAPDLLFGWARSARMALHTASGMILAAIGLWLGWSSSDWYVSSRFFREDEKIRLLGSIILFVVTVTVGLTGFVLLQSSLEKALENNLVSTAHNRRPWFAATAARTLRYAESSARLAGLDEAGVALLSSPTAENTTRFTQIAGRLVREGVRGIALRDAAGKVRHSAGRVDEQPELAAALDGARRSWLIWDKELILRNIVPLSTQGQPAGSMLIDLAAPQLDSTLFNASHLGKTGEIHACIAAGKGLHCFPGNRQSTPFTIAPRSATAQPLPAEYALQGKSGVAYALDYRGENVVAAYAELAPGLGFVVKQDTKEAYAAIRQALTIGAPIIVLVAVLGTVFLNSQLLPLVTRMRKSELALTRLAQYDSLTGLPNRYLFMDLLRTAVARSRRSGSAMALMFLDLDGFKHVNDTMGHAAGDHLLIQFAQRLSALMRGTDVVARLAGDEFTVLLEELANPEEDVHVVAGKILAAVSTPFPIDGQHARVTVSIGMVIHSASAQAVDVEQLLQRADQGMYAAKQSGKNAYQLA